MSDLPEYRLERTFDAPRALVWRAWTDPDILHRWYGPGIDTIIHEFNPVAGGKWLNEMRMGENSMFSKMLFQEVIDGEKMIWLHHSWTDAEWNDAKNPMMSDWPRVLLTTVTFTEEGDQTVVTLTQIPQDASDAEIACFAEHMANMDGGWGSGYKIIDEILAELQSGS